MKKSYKIIQKILCELSYLKKGLFVAVDETFVMKKFCC